MRESFYTLIIILGMVAFMVLCFYVGVNLRQIIGG